MNWKLRLVAIAVFGLAACGGGDVDKKGKAAECGNGLLGPSETCDPGIAAGNPGACPTMCAGEGDESCGATMLVGDPFACTAECVMVEVSCGAEDGCCPSGCDSTDDVDCSNTCGNGTVEGSEVCDGNCPSTCDDRDTCTIDSFSGSVDTCNLRCENAPLSDCIDGDGCCPDGCSSSEDDDCSESCGDDTLDPGELCDGDCPTDCADDGDACTTERLVGSPSTCNAQCLSDPITTCQSGDGCCPQGCTVDNDTDCSCAPRTCADVGWECGMLDDLCGSTRSCGACDSDERCSAGACVPNNMSNGALGDPCTSDAGCLSGRCTEEDVTGFPGGYCTATCETNADCGAGNVCGGNKYCWKGCSSSAQCRPTYGCEPLFGGTERVCRAVGTGTRAVGLSCDTVTECAGGSSAQCKTNALGWKDGYCSPWCDGTTTCPGGSNCVEGVGCAKSCSTNADCRGAGYLCFDIDDNGSKECYQAGTGTGRIGAACAGAWECAGGEGGFCAVEANGFPDGYCATECGPNSECPVGAVCGFLFASGYCLDECITDADCRAGYSCTQDFLQNVCWPT